MSAFLVTYETPAGEKRTVIKATDRLAAWSYALVNIGTADRLAAPTVSAL